MREGHTEVLVVGAGPVGLWAALLLAEAGIEVKIIDREERTTTRSYACALHPATLSRLHQLGLANVLIEAGRRVSTVAFYEGETRRAEVSVAASGGEFPFLLILPQNVLERALEQRLRQAGVTVHWNHRFDSMVQEEELVASTVEELGGTGTGYAVPEWEATVKNRSPLRSQFVIGADGHHSLVRNRLGLDFQPLAGTASFAAYEFESDAAGPNEVRVVLDGASTNVLWPLPGNKLRWTFQLLRSETPAEFPEKQRRAARVAHPEIDERIRQYIRQTAQRRAPWFSAGVKELAWSSEVSFASRLVKQFGRERCWLAGDAAHQTGPVGVQSMNAGFAEGDQLARLLPQIIRGSVPVNTMTAYEQNQQGEWRKLLGLTGGLSARAGADAWVKQHAASILPCLPGLGSALAALAAQIRLDVAQNELSLVGGI